MTEEKPLPPVTPPNVTKIVREIDWDRVPLPSDRVTLGRLRQALAGNHDGLATFVHNLTLAEQEVASSALSEALRMPYDKDAAWVPHVLKKEHARELAKLYMDAGLAAGQHEAAERIRELEDWAASEARKHIPEKLR